MPFNTILFNFWL